jgi:hypothetical protein
MEVGTLYPTMDEFKLAVRQFAINNEFNLGVEKSCKTIYRAYCKSGDEDRPFPWRINGRKHNTQATTEVNIFYFISCTCTMLYKIILTSLIFFILQVTVLVDEHSCMSSMRQTNTTPSCKWVASKAESILREDPHIGATELQKRLERESTSVKLHMTLYGRVKKGLLMRFMENGQKVLSYCIGGRLR